jgi:hypothetical protein
MTRARWFTLTLLCGFYACATPDRRGYSVVKSTVALDAHRLGLSNNLYPWYHGSTSGEIVVSNACGFVNFTYEASSLSDYLAKPTVPWSPAPFQVLTGEWCQIRPFVFDHDTLVRYRLWYGTYYLLAAAPILRDDVGVIA